MGWKIIARVSNGEEERVIHVSGMRESQAENRLKEYYLDKGYNVIEKTGFYYKLSKIKRRIEK